MIYSICIATYQVKPADYSLDQISRYQSHTACYTNYAAAVITLELAALCSALQY